VNVYQVLTERTDEKTKEVIEVSRFVTNINNNVYDIVDYFVEYCKKTGEKLLSVMYVLTISQNIS
jgi:flagellar biosynthesis chaperone FliJ